MRERHAVHRGGFVTGLRPSSTSVPDPLVSGHGPSVARERARVPPGDVPGRGGGGGAGAGAGDPRWAAPRHGSGRGEGRRPGTGHLPGAGSAERCRDHLVHDVLVAGTSAMLAAEPPPPPQRAEAARFLALRLDALGALLSVGRVADPASSCVLAARPRRSRPACHKLRDIVVPLLCLLGLAHVRATRAHHAARNVGGAPGGARAPARLTRWCAVRSCTGILIPPASLLPTSTASASCWSTAWACSAPMLLLAFYSGGWTASCRLVLAQEGRQALRRDPVTGNSRLLTGSRARRQRAFLDQRRPPPNASGHRPHQR